MWDALVVGARCAGASTALLLARRGYRVLLIDRATFPSDTLSTLYIHQPGIARLEQWGLLDAVIASGCPRLETVSYHIQDLLLRGPVATMGNITATYAPRRQILDQILIEAAIAAGVEFADGCSLSGLLTEDNRVTGVRFRANGGDEVSEQARLVVGADGMRSRVADLAGATAVVEDPRLSCVYYTGWAGLSCGLGIREQPGSSIGTVPTHDGVTLVLTYFPQESFHQVKADPFQAHLDSIRRTAPDVFEEIAGTEPALRLHGTGDQQNFFRTAHGPGWVLVGDAGHHLDSITARGITNAFIQAELLTDEIGDGLPDSQHTDAALARFAKRRQDALIDVYQSTLETARLRVPDSRLKMLRSISREPALIERYFALVAGIISMDEFLTPALIKLLYR
jgi:2-polyprenyl-6-methoxyphenol hydroxylase-like FAD-dependent oxidoreductase